MRSLLRVTLTALAFTVAALALPVTLGAVTLNASFEDRYTPRNDGIVPRPAHRPHDPAKPTAVVVVGNEGAVVSDALAPYEVLAASGAFNVYTVAPEVRPVTLTGGLDLVPDLGFADLDRLLPSAAPDVVVVPALPDLGEPTTRPVTEWLNRQSARGSLLMSVCNGSGVLATAGLLDGRKATSHWIRIDGFDDEFPAVDWIRGTRYVDDGNILTTAGILSGIDGALRLTERFAGTETARKTAEAVGWAHYSPGSSPPMELNSFEAADTVVGFNTAFRWDKPRLEVLLTTGIRELELAAVFDTYGQSLAVETRAVGLDGTPIRSRHGLTFAPRGTPSPGLDRLIVPGTDAAASHAADRYSGRSPVYLHAEPGFPFDAVLEDLARTTDAATTRWTSRTLEYRPAHLALDGEAWPWTVTLRPFGLAVLGLLVAFGIRAVSRRFAGRGPSPLRRGSGDSH
ncbi:DJ-1/PfpI family protein [Amycolatopsis roodepoortensis]|uniref:Intracellular protease/amidase n=1 Tax=Amycolatopsis roodepoortensis TaxID=700274 RepID=A0ABR9L200_9PSEU|nr:DJ-1/PfpI family protein [Amycolatopsis roodepoortensis]MBE1574679.1 putative intracellular protease/amidase [Amycolatopsis roodepoortensis]